MTPATAPALTRKAVATTSIVALFLFGALFLGRVELVALAAPFAVALLWGLAAAPDPGIAVGCRFDLDRCIEGDEVTVEVRTTARRRVGEAAIGVVLPAGMAVASGDKHTTAALDLDREWSMRLVVRPRRWGAYRIGPIVVRSYGPGRYVVRETVVEIAKLVRVYPAPDRLRRGVAPPRTQVFSGNYVSRAAGEGIEFAGVREFGPTDSVRRINWRVTSRRGDLYLNVFHPERNADVILFLDTFGDAGSLGRSTLDLTVRGASAVARHYLIRKDRVGLVNFGGTLGWITAAQGQVHTYRIVDYLLGVQATWSYAWKDLDVLPVGILPPLSTVVAFSPLLDKRAVGALVDLQARGFPLLIVDTLVEDAVAPAASREGRLAWRVWKMQRAAVGYDLQRLGIPVVQWPEDDALEAVLARVPLLRRRAGARLA